MSKTLIIAEKPSVAKDIAAALGVPRSGDVYENDSLVISNCVGHLVEIYSEVAEANRSMIPVIPDPFQLRPIERASAQFSTVKKLMARKDVTIVANACDAGREGEAIFRLTYELAGCKKKTERLWLQSMTKDGILAAWTGRSPGEKYDNLSNAARCRAESDWLVGINGSRACRQAVGRVMSPTLALVVDRFLANRDFVPKDYFEVFGTFKIASGEFKAEWLSKSDKKIEDRAACDAIVAKCTGKAPSSIEDESKPTKTSPPFLFDLTSLQREANKRFKFSAKKTLDIAQVLYEKHKVTSYPRTDSQRLPDDYVSKCQSVLGELAKISGFGATAQKPISEGWVKPNKRIFDSTKISDHFAIIPTGVIPSGLTGDEQKIFDFVAKRFIAIFYPDAEFTSTTRTVVVADESFRTSGRVLVKSGWLEVAGKGDDDEKTPALSVLKPGEKGETVKIETICKQTKPPALYTEATLLTAMETAGKALDDDELADAMKERGLGTPATRAATIEKLLNPGKSGSDMERIGNNLAPTEKGISIVAHCRKHAPKLVSPILTGEWENKLLMMEKGKFSREEFMKEIKSFVIELSSSAAKGGSGGGGGGEQTKVDAPCPACGEALIFDGRVVRHTEGSACAFKLWGTISGKKLSTDQIKDLLTGETLPTISGFLSKDKKPFAAGLRLEGTDGKVAFVFDQGKQSGVACPRCKEGLLLSDKKATCKCGFTIWINILGVRLTDIQLIMLLEEGKTENIGGFISAKKKEFSAALVFDREKEAVTFDFSASNNATQEKHKDGEKCPKCKKGKLGHKKNKEGKNFLGCSGYPACRFFEWA